MSHISCRHTGIFIKRSRNTWNDWKQSSVDFFKFLKTNFVKYLGHVVSQDGIETDPDKIKALTTWPALQNVKQLRSVLGFAGYYWRFLKNYACIVKLLDGLLIGHPTNPGVNRKKKSEVLGSRVSHNKLHLTC